MRDVPEHVGMLFWADRHLERVQSSAEDFMRRDPFIASCEPDVKHRTKNTLEYAFTVRHRQPVTAPPEDVAFEIGDALHAMRVSLDYLAVHVVTKAIPSTDEGKVAFPIFTNPKKFGSLKDRRIPGVSGKLLTAFEAAQPYSGRYGARPETDPLSILDALEQPHKHRRLLSTLTGVYDFIPQVVSGDPRHAICLHITLPTVPLGRREKAEVARFRIGLGVDGQPKACVKGNTRFFVCFDRNGPALGAPAVSLLKAIRQRVAETISGFNDFV
jgi:hypothetical protein